MFGPVGAGQIVGGEVEREFGCEEESEEEHKQTGTCESKLETVAL